MFSSISPAGARWRYLAVPALVALALGLTACGGDDDGDGEDTTTTGVQQAFDEALRQNLIDTQGMSEAVADCVIDELHQSVSEEDLQEVTTGEVPKSITDAAFDAGFKCASEAEGQEGGG